MQSTVRLSGLFMLVLLLLLSSPLVAAEIRVAVASNFLIPIKTIAREYEQETGDKLIISAGSTGKLYAQIMHGAPFDVFLAANEREPERLEKEGYALSGSRFTYARGRLALWDPKGLYRQASLEAVLKSGDYQRLSVANPLTAPYGAAAIDVLQTLKLDQLVQARLLRGENVSQAYQYVASGAADLGFVALSQLKASSNVQPNSFWIVDEVMHAPILQQAVLLNRARENSRAQAFLEYLKNPQGQARIERFGYSLL